MYRTSADLRFTKNRDALRRAYIDLVKEKGSSKITVRELTVAARVNRMTFYSHYDAVSDILTEYVDDMTAAILATEQPQTDTEGIGELFARATELMRQEIDFFRLVAREGGFEPFRSRFRDAFRHIFQQELGRRAHLEGTRLAITADMAASAVTYAYLDWLSGDYPELSLEDLIRHFEKVLGRLTA